MTLKDLFHNDNFKVLDAASGSLYSIKEINTDYWKTDDSQSLVFAYLDNTIQSVTFLINVLCSNHTVALLSNDLIEDFKEDLEDLYTPKYIFDSTRGSILNYISLESHLYKLKGPDQLHIDKRIKVLLSTSGSTGSPKLVKLSEENLLSNAKSIASYLPIKYDDVVPLNLPLSYSYGLSILTSNCVIGNTVVCGLPDIMSRDFWSCFSELGFTTIAGVPFVYEVFDRIGFLKKQHPSLRYFTQAGGRLSDTLISKFGTYAKVHGYQFYIMYGQTEATARMSYLPPHDLLDNIGSIGNAIQGGEFTIDVSNSELLYSGSNVFGGYAKSKYDLSKFESITRLKTGDLAEINSNGYYIITGRIKRFIKLYGKRINLDEVQRLVSEKFKRQIICFGYKDKKLCLAHEDDLDFDEVRTWISKEFLIYHGSIDFYLITTCPRTANGKIDYQRLIEFYED